MEGRKVRKQEGRQAAAGVPSFVVEAAGARQSFLMITSAPLRNPSKTLGRVVVNGFSPTLRKAVWQASCAMSIVEKRDLTAYYTHF